MPLGTGNNRDTVAMPFWVAARATSENWLEKSFVGSPMGTTRTRSALVFFSTRALMAVVVPGRFVNVTEPVTGVAFDDVFAE